MLEGNRTDLVQFEILRRKHKDTEEGLTNAMEEVSRLRKCIPTSEHEVLLTTLKDENQALRGHADTQARAMMDLERENRRVRE